MSRPLGASDDDMQSQTTMTSRTTAARSPRGRARLRRGVETIELAVTLPVVLLVIFAGFEIGWAILCSTQLDHAARVGAREAALSGSTAQSVEDRVRVALDEAGIKGATISMNPSDPTSAATGEPITVEVRVDYANIQLLGLSKLMRLPAELGGKAAMAKEPDS